MALSEWLIGKYPLAVFVGWDILAPPAPEHGLGNNLSEDAPGYRIRIRIHGGLRSEPAGEIPSLSKVAS